MRYVSVTLLNVFVCCCLLWIWVKFSVNFFHRLKIIRWLGSTQDSQLETLELVQQQLDVIKKSSFISLLLQSLPCLMIGVRNTLPRRLPVAIVSSQVWIAVHLTRVRWSRARVAVQTQGIQWRNWRAELHLLITMLWSLSHWKWILNWPSSMSSTLYVCIMKNICIIIYIFVYFFGISSFSSYSMSVDDNFHLDRGMSGAPAQKFDHAGMTLADSSFSMSMGSWSQVWHWCTCVICSKVLCS